ncbi:MAG: nucleotidyltransferase domain-containing protein [Chitinivibrionales bacterium]|nr:nucleotidyltransferase domain-containing protein [Chitinivibrionales bacterium]
MIDITSEHLAIVRQILAEFVPEAEVFIFGSRATASAKRHSDLDLLIKGNAMIQRNLLKKLKIAFEESELPFRVDVVDWATTKRPFRDTIQKNAVNIASI